MDHLIAPHGGTLCNLIVDEVRAEALKTATGDALSVTLNERQTCDLELLMNGGFSPLRGFMDQAAYEAVVDGMHLPDGTLWSIPVTLDVPDRLAEKIEPGQRAQPGAPLELGEPRFQGLGAAASGGQAGAGAVELRAQRGEVLLELADVLFETLARHPGLARLLAPGRDRLGVGVPGRVEGRGELLAAAGGGAQLVAEAVELVLEVRDLHPALREPGLGVAHRGFGVPAFQLAARPFFGDLLAQGAPLELVELLLPAPPRTRPLLDHGDREQAREQARTTEHQGLRGYGHRVFGRRWRV